MKSLSEYTGKEFLEELKTLQIELQRQVQKHCNVVHMAYLKSEHHITQKEIVEAAMQQTAQIILGLGSPSELDLPEKISSEDCLNRMRMTALAFTLERVSPFDFKLQEFYNSITGNQLVEDSPAPTAITPPNHSEENSDDR